jgi:uncharacterized protein YdeI (YjbR/CyaY-like superfamily)
MNPEVDDFLEKAEKWRDEFEKLRQILLDCNLTEELKWGNPCYTSRGKNIVLIHGFKEYCALLFFKGALLSDPEGILIRQTDNVQSARQVRFTNAGEITALAVTLKAYVLDAVEIEKAGLKVELKRTSDYKIPGEFGKILNENRALRAAFETLTPGRQRAYLMFFSQPKQAKTRVQRIEKSIPQILGGKGLND